METPLFPLLKIPEFKETQLNEQKFISTKFLYEGPKGIFKKVISNFISDENKRKNYISRSSYTQFIKEFCKKNKIVNVLKAAKTEWNHMEEHQKVNYKDQELGLTASKLKPIKIIKKCRPIRCSYSIFVEVKCKEKSRTYQELGKKWRSLPEEKKISYQKLYVADKERVEFEKNVFSRFELALRLFGACSSTKLIRKYNGFNVYKEELRASLIERGFTKMPNLDIIGRKRYIKLDGAMRKSYKNAAAIKNDEMIEQVFEKVYKKVNVDYGELTGVENEDANGNLLYEEDFEEFLNEETGFIF